MTDLSLVSENELIEEIKRRNEVTIVATIKTYDDKTEGFKSTFSGGKFNCIGMCKRLEVALLALCVADENDPPTVER